MSNQFESKGRDQNVGQGEGAIGKQINNYYTGAPPTPAEATCSLPAEDAVFLHRKEELAWLDEHLHPDRVVAVCGPGGMGKSALAARALRRLPADRFPDGMVFHTFYHQPKTAMAVQTLALALGIKGEANPEQQVTLVLGGKQALLILDGAEEAEDLPAVLRLRGRCGVLITSRRKSDAGALRLDLPPLPDEQAEDVLRAWTGESREQEAIERIAELLGGWPVALRIAGHYLHSTGEPAANYLRWLEQEPLRELDTGEEHQRDNAALLLDRSVAQVSADARLALGLAGALAFDLLAAEPITALLEDDERRARMAINELFQYGLLERRGDRLHIGHALIHQYAATRLALSPDELARPAAYYIDWCRTQSAAGLEGYALLDGERVHCLRLIESCLKSELWQEVKLLVGTIDIYLERQGYWAEELAALEMRLTAARLAGDRRDEAWCLNNLGYTCDNLGDKDQALRWYAQCLPLWRELGERKEEGVTLNNMAAIYLQQGRYEQALETYQQSLSIKQEVGDREGEGTTLNNIGMLYKAQGEYEQALQYYEQCLPITRETGNTIGEGTTLNNIAAIYDAQGKPSKALEYHEQALAIRREQGDRAGEAISRWWIGLTYRDMGDLTKAEEYISRAVEIMEAIHHPKLETCREGLEQLRAKQQM
ncbi:MAG: tetratricopeptide repeat protein [Candidatus Electrothrix scaldis]|nr:MAG: tetratricopeptide repeat protein [Candidatus Electrothrix sp. GW3-3]